MSKWHRLLKLCIVVLDKRRMDVRRWIGERFRQFRESLGISVQRVAKGAGVSRQYVHLVEKGGANITIDTFVDMLSACGLTFQDFQRSMQSSDIPEAHQHAHKWLEEILNSEQDRVIEGILTNLQGLALLARTLKSVHFKALTRHGEDQSNDKSKDKLPPFSPSNFSLPQRNS